MKDLNLIRKIAWNFYQANSGKIEFEELFSEASLAYSLALQKHKGNKTTTFFYICMNNHLLDFCKKENFFQFRNDKTSYFDPCYEMQDPFTELYKELPSDCKEIADLILEYVDSIPEEAPKKMRGSVVKILRQNDWSWPSIWDGFKHFKLALNYN